MVLYLMKQFTCLYFSNPLLIQVRNIFKEFFQFFNYSLFHFCSVTYSYSIIIFVAEIFKTYLSYNLTQEIPFFKFTSEKSFLFPIFSNSFNLPYFPTNKKIPSNSFETAGKNLTYPCREQSQIF